MYRLLGDDYHFIETQEIPAFRTKLGYQEIKTPYVLKYNEQTRAEIDEMIMDADAVIFGEAPLNLIKKRYNARRLTFRDDESRFKNPNRYLKWPIYTYMSHWLNKGYLLCASAYAPIDYLLSGMRRKHCFRWAYFTEVKQYDIDSLMSNKRIVAPDCISILWAGRLIGLKHPESTIRVAEHLKGQRLSFDINIIGGGELEEELKHIVALKGLSDNIHFLGSMSPTEVRRYMELSDIFLFTSDRQEGWGAVLNESMNSGCAVVADSNIGSVPYLVEDGVNGIIYKSKNWRDLCMKVENLIRNPQFINQLGKNAYRTMSQIWNSKVAARNFIVLCESIMNKTESPIHEGPCSNSPVIMRKWRGSLITL